MKAPVCRSTTLAPLEVSAYRTPGIEVNAAGMPLAVLNLGRTRADGLATLKVHADCALALARPGPSSRAGRPGSIDR